MVHRRVLSLQRLIQIRDQIVGVFDADGEADRVGRGASRPPARPVIRPDAAEKAQGINSAQVPGGNGKRGRGEQSISNGIDFDARGPGNT